MNINHALIERILELAIRIQQIPAPTFGEGPRAEFIQKCFEVWGAKEVSIDEVGNVYTHIRGEREKAIIVVSAHLDTVFPQDTELTSSRNQEKITGPGIGDNSLGLAGLFGLYSVFNKDMFKQSKKPGKNGDLWLVANVGEEGLGDLKGMKAVVDRFGHQPVAYIVLEGMALGQIYHRGLGVRRYRIRVNTKGGHSWVDYGSPSAIHELADLVVQIKEIPIPIDPRSSLNVGMINGGTSVNTIAAQASLELDLRSESSHVLNSMIERVERLVQKADRKGGQAIRVSAEVIGNRPAGEIPAYHPLVNAAMNCYASHGIKAKLNIGSTDANEPLSRGFPAICVGLTTGSGSHTTGEYIDTRPVALGMKILVDLINTIFQMG
ncbi:MAG: M20/M25/M40 family metallo-hydrolase [Anaerolineales bacterium]